MTKYIVVIEFTNNIRYTDSDGYMGCTGYVEDFMALKELILKVFGNHILALSTTCYLIKSNETEKELLETIKQLVKSRFDKEFYDFKHQVYLAAISSFEYATFREKEFEVEYINRE